MADAVRASCAAPVFKRPRLEFSACEGEALISYESVSSEERFSIDSGLQEDVYEGTSSNDCPMERTSDPSPNGNTTALTDNGGMHQQKDASDNVPLPSMLESLVSLWGEESCYPKDEDQDSTISELSGLSDLSNVSDGWKPNSGESSWVERQRTIGMDPRAILTEIMPEMIIPTGVDEGLLWRHVLGALYEPQRAKLPRVNTLDDAVGLLRTCSRVIVLTGAGVSVSCGIPDFRSRNGLYARLSQDYPDLPDPQAMFDISYFRKDPRPFFKFAKEIYPGQFRPSPSHRFIRLLEKQGKLLRNYTQNIDTLEHAVGIRNVITCHGSFATATCTICRYKVDSSVIKEDIFNQSIPYCPVCPSGDVGERGIMKPDIVFFGEGLSDEFHMYINDDKDTCDLLIVVGSSLKVRPVASIPSSIPPDVPQILINREPLKHHTFDIELLGDCDVILGELCRRLKSEWTIEDIPGAPLREIRIPPTPAPLSLGANLASLDASLDFGAEINNNLQHPRETIPSESQGDESNSCDYAYLSAIRLEDSSEDGSSSQPPEEKQVATGNVHDLIKKLPGDSYLFLPPSRYVFRGAEIGGEEEDSCSDCSSPGSPDLPCPPTEEENKCTPAPDHSPLEEEPPKGSPAKQRDATGNAGMVHDFIKLVSADSILSRYVSRWAADDSCSSGSSDSSNSPRPTEKENKCTSAPKHSPLREEQAPKASHDT